MASLPVRPSRPDAVAPAVARRTPPGTLRVFTGGGFTTAALRDMSDGVRLLAVDDPKGKRPPVLDITGRHELRKVADEGGVVIVTVPRSHALEPSATGERLREEWASVADVVVELVPGSLGDADIVTWQNRRGAAWDVPVTLLAHQARSVDRAVGG